MSDSVHHVHTHLNILLDQEEVRILIQHIRADMTAHDLAALLESTARELQKYPAELTLADIKKRLADKDGRLV